MSALAEPTLPAAIPSSLPSTDALSVSPPPLVTSYCTEISAALRDLEDDTTRGRITAETFVEPVPESNASMQSATGAITANVQSSPDSHISASLLPHSHLLPHSGDNTTTLKALVARLELSIDQMAINRAESVQRDELTRREVVQEKVRIDALNQAAAAQTADLAQRQTSLEKRERVVEEKEKSYEKMKQQLAEERSQMEENRVVAAATTTSSTSSSTIDYATQISSLSSQITALQSSLSHKDHECSILIKQARIQAKDEFEAAAAGGGGKDVAKLRQQLNKAEANAQQSKDALNEILDELTNIQIKYNEKVLQLKESKDREEKLKEEVEVVRKKLEEAATLSSTVPPSNSSPTTSDQYATLLKQYADLELKYLQDRAISMTLQSEHTAQLSQERHELSQLQEKYAELEEEAERDSTELTESHHRITTLESQLLQSKQSFQFQQEQHEKELENMIRMEHESHEKKETGLEQEVKEWKGKVEELEKQLQVEKEAAVKLVASSDDLQQLQQKLTEQEAKFTAREQQLLSDCTLIRTTLTTLESTLASSKLQLTNSQSKLSASETQLSDLQASYLRLETIEDSTRATLSQSQLQYDTLRTSYTKLTKALKRMKTDTSSLRHDLGKMKDRTKEEQDECLQQAMEMVMVMQEKQKEVVRGLEQENELVVRKLKQEITQLAHQLETSQSTLSAKLLSLQQSYQHERTALLSFVQSRVERREVKLKQQAKKVIVSLKEKHKAEITLLQQQHSLALTAQAHLITSTTNTTTATIDHEAKLHALLEHYEYVQTERRHEVEQAQLDKKNREEMEKMRAEEMEKKEKEWKDEIARIKSQYDLEITRLRDESLSLTTQYTVARATLSRAHQSSLDSMQILLSESHADELVEQRRLDKMKYEEEYKRYQKELENLEKEMHEKHQTELAEIETLRTQEKVQYEADLARLTSELTQLQSDLTLTHQSEIEQLNVIRSKERESFETERGRLEQELVNMKRDGSQALNAEITRLEALRTSDQSTFQQEQTRLSSELSAATSQIVQLQDSLTQRDTEYQKQLTKEKALQKKYDSLRASSKQQLKKSQEDLIAIQTSSKEKETQLSVAEELIQSLQVQIGEEKSAAATASTSASTTSHPILTFLSSTTSSFASFTSQDKRLLIRASSTFLNRLHDMKLSEMFELLGGVSNGGAKDDVLQHAISLLQYHLSHSSSASTSTPLDELGRYALHLACSSSSSSVLHKDLIELIYKSYPAAVKIQDKQGRLPVWYAMNSLMNIDISSASSSQQKKHLYDLLKYLITRYPESMYLSNTLNNINAGTLSRNISSATYDDDDVENGTVGNEGDEINENNNLLVTLLANPMQTLTATPIFHSNSSLISLAFSSRDKALLTMLHELTCGEFLTHTTGISSSSSSYLHLSSIYGEITLVRWLLDVGKVNPWLLNGAGDDRTALEYVTEMSEKLREISSDASADEVTNSTIQSRLTQLQEVATYLTLSMTRSKPEVQVKMRRGVNANGNDVSNFASTLSSAISLPIASISLDSSRSVGSSLSLSVSPRVQQQHSPRTANHSVSPALRPVIRDKSPRGVPQQQQMRSPPPQQNLSHSRQHSAASILNYNHINNNNHSDESLTQAQRDEMDELSLTLQSAAPPMMISPIGQQQLPISALPHSTNSHHTTHIHFYPSNPTTSVSPPAAVTPAVAPLSSASMILSSSRSLPALKHSPRTVAAAAATTTTEKAEDEQDSSISSSSSSSRSTTSLHEKNPSKVIGSYHWQFLDTPMKIKSPTIKPAATPIVSGAGKYHTPQTQQQQQQDSSPPLLQPHIVESTIHSLQATADNLNQLMSKMQHGTKQQKGQIQQQQQTKQVVRR